MLTLRSPCLGLLALVLALLACSGPANPAAAGRGAADPGASTASVRTPGPAVTLPGPSQPAPSVPVATAAVAAAAAAPRLAWVESYDALLLEASDPAQFPGVTAGLPPGAGFENYLPTARLWGDGRIVWVEYQPATGARRVLEGQLSRPRLVYLLQRILDSGFFDQTSAFRGLYQATFPSLYVHLQGVEKTYLPPPDARPPWFDDLLAWLGHGGGASAGGPYQPRTARLCATPLPQGGQTALRWPAELAGFSLVPLRCRSVSGPALDFAWEAVNRSPAAPLVDDQGAVYLLTLKLKD